jgi:cytochrome b pre-mRNA-processing protein 3
VVLGRLFTRPDVSRVAGELYRKAVVQARNSAFYAEMGVPDTVDGRFDMIALHVFLILRSLKSGAGAEVAQALFDAMFADMDRALREMGSGDLGVGRRVKAMARAFYGRLAAYDDALGGADGVLAAAIGRNLYRGADPGPVRLEAICGYVRREAAALDARPIEHLLAGRIAFGPPPALAQTPSGAVRATAPRPE